MIYNITPMLISSFDNYNIMEMLILKEGGAKVFENSLQYVCNFSVSLKLLQNKNVKENF